MYVEDNPISLILEVFSKTYFFRPSCQFFPQGHPLGEQDASQEGNIPRSLAVGAKDHLVVLDVHYCSYYMTRALEGSGANFERMGKA